LLSSTPSGADVKSVVRTLGTGYHCRRCPSGWGRGQQNKCHIKGADVNIVKLCVEQWPVIMFHFIKLLKIRVITFSSNLQLNCKIVTIFFTVFVLGWTRTSATNSEISQGGSLFVKRPVSTDASFRSYAPLFEACRAGTCTQSVHFESVYVYVYNVEPSDDSFLSPPTLRLCR
jgi:hypothetical protein